MIPGHDKVKVIGEGSFGRVHLCRRRSDGAEVAVKKIRLDTGIGGDADKLLGKVLQEYNICIKLNHKNIVATIELITKPGRACYIVMEFCSGGDLRAVIANAREKLPEPKITTWVLELAEAVNYLHHLDPPILHRDIKSQNCYLTNDEVLKLGDFGISRLKEESELKNAGNTFRTVGTVTHYSPQICIGEPYGVKDEVYAVGVVLYEMIMRKLPYCVEASTPLLSAFHTMELIKQNKREPIPYNLYGPKIVDLAEQMLNRDPDLRPDIGRVIIDLTSESLIPLVIEAAKSGDDTTLEQRLKQLPSTSISDFLRMSNDMSGKTAMHWAAINGDVEILKLLYRFGAPLDARDANNSTALYYALCSSHNDAAKLIIESDHAGTEMKSALLQFIRDAAPTNNNFSPVELLVSFGFDIANTALDSQGSTALHLAVESGKLELVTFFYRKGARFVNCFDRHGLTPLHRLCSNDKSVQFLSQILKDAEFSEDIGLMKSKNEGHSLLQLAILSGATNIVELLFSLKPTLVSVADISGCNALQLAAKLGQAELFQKMLHLDSWQTLGFTNHQVLGYTFASGHASVFEAYAKEKGCWLDYSSKRTILHEAVDKRYLGAVALLANANSTKYTLETGQLPEDYKPIHLAALNDDAEVLDVLLDNKCKLESLDKSKNTALSLAVLENKIKAVKVLLARNANVEHVNKDGLRPLHLATKQGHVEMVKLLLDHGASISATKYYTKETALHMAASSGQLEVLQLILSKEGDIPLQELMNKSISEKHSAEVLTLLMRAINAKQNADQRSQYFFAFLRKSVEKGNLESIRLLLEKFSSEQNSVLTSAQISELMGLAMINDQLACFITILDIVRPKDIRDLLKEAVDKRNEQCVYALLNWTAAKDLAKSNERLREAAKIGSAPAAIFLLQRRARMDGRDGDTNMTALHVAVKAGHLSVVEAFIKYDYRLCKAICTDESGKFSLQPLNSDEAEGSCVAILKKELFKYLTPERKMVATKPESMEQPLPLLPKTSRTDVGLVNAPSIISVDDTTKERLFSAAMTGDSRQWGSNVDDWSTLADAEGRSILHVATFYGHHLFVSNLLKYDRQVCQLVFDEKRFHNTPLHVAVTRNDTIFVELYVGCRFNVEQEDSNGYRPIHLAAMYGHCEALALLLKNKADLYASDRRGHTVLHIAIIYRQKGILSYLKQDHGAIENIEKFQTRRVDGRIIEEMGRIMLAEENKSPPENKNPEHKNPEYKNSCILS